MDVGNELVFGSKSVSSKSQCPLCNCVGQWWYCAVAVEERVAGMCCPVYVVRDSQQSGVANI